MASWTMQYRTEAMDREPGFYWQDLDGVNGEDPNDFFGQFVDFDGNTSAMASSSMTATTDAPQGDQAVPRLPEPLMLDPHNHGQSGHPSQQPPPSESLGSSTTDEFDFSHFGPATSSSGPAAAHDIDPSSLALGANDAHFLGYPQPGFLAARGSMSDTELPKVEGMTLSSPIKDRFPSASQPPSPGPPPTASTVTGTTRKTNRFLDAVQSTIRKATNRRKPRQPLPENRPGSPVADAPIRAPRQRPRRGVSTNNLNTAAQAPVPMPVQQQQPQQQQQHTFVHGNCEDPFGDVSSLAPPHYQGQEGLAGSPLESPGIKSEAESFHTDHTTSQMPAEIQWQQVQQPRHQSCSLPSSAAGQWNGQHQHHPSMVNGSGDPSWWDFNVVNSSGEYVDPRNADINMAMHSQQAGLPYEYQAHHQQPQQPQQQGMPGEGLMIQMPQPRQAHHSVANDLHMSAQTQLHPPPPPIPQASSSSHRPPRAPSSGARHLSMSPVRKTRAPSASPTRGTPSQKRHSSGGSISSTRSASGRQPSTSVPGTPSGVRKRRSRDPSGGLGGAGGGGGGGLTASTSGGFSFDNAGGGGGGGFVNFTPNDGSMLMTGVAPSGSSKTKARREKEALDRRRKLSEAAIKAVAAAGGDVEKLMQQGFQF